jgi:ferredoxin-type protein NapG
MGVAGLSSPQRCLSHTSAAYCDSCFRACPMKFDAIRMVVGRGEHGRNFTPTVDAAHCTGCGLCEQACVLDGVAAITVRASHAQAA